MGHTSWNSDGKRTVLVAGGAGFLGSHLCEWLIRKGHKVYCVDNFETGSAENLTSLQKQPRFTLIRHDICEPLPDKLRIDAIYNLACAASPLRYQADPIHTMMTSVLGTRHLLDLAEAAGARFLQASTSEIYGDPERHPQSEDYWGHVNPTGPRACYDEGKRAAETLCFDYLRLKRVDVRVARIFNTYGPRMQPDDGRIISNLISQAISSRPLTINGTGQQTRSFCYVSDLIRGLTALMEAASNPGQPMNLGNPREFTINELAGLVLTFTGSLSPIVYRPLPVDDPKRRRPDVSRARSVLGWSPRVPLAQGLPPTIAWMSEHLAGLRGAAKPPRRAGAKEATGLAEQRA